VKQHEKLEVPAVEVPPAGNQSFQSRKDTIDTTEALGAIETRIERTHKLLATATNLGCQARLSAHRQQRDHIVGGIFPSQSPFLLPMTG
jgi:hypothetical protein